MPPTTNPVGEDDESVGRREKISDINNTDEHVII